MMGGGFPPSPRAVRRFVRGLRVRIGATIALLFGGLSWVLLYLAFYASRFDWFQNFAVVLVSLVAIPVAVVAMWISWGISLGHRFHRHLWNDEFL